MRYSKNHRRKRCARFVLGMIVAGLGVGCANPGAARFQAHVDYLASDELGGRGVGTPGIDKAAEYIAAEFERFGLEPAGDEDTYFQIFPLAVRRKYTSDARLAFAGDTEERILGQDFIPFHFSSNDQFDGPVVFCGYGIVNPDKNHDDFGDLNLEGKVALILRGEPDSWSADSGAPTHHATFRNKIYNAKDRDAAAVLIVNQVQVEGEEDVLVEFVEESSEAYGIPAFHITREFAASRLAAAQMPSLEELESKLDEGEFLSQPLAHQTASGYAGLETIEAPVSNVVAMLRGRGPEADECVVIGAHYDHLGVRRPMTRRFKAGKLVQEEKPPQIHNGADDNASGVAGLIEIARMFAEGPPRDRSVVFVAFTAEESGLHGSKYFIEHPVCQPDHTAAMLNMDMIGRMKPGADQVLVFGAESGKGVGYIVTKAARRLGMTYEVTGDSGGRSDHAPFVQSSIPSMHFMTGLHRDYHQPSDDAEKINPRGGAKVARLVHDVAARLADEPKRPEFVALKRKRAPASDSGGTPSYRVVMGLAPGYADDGKPGMAVEYVTDEGPAFMAGMRGGDRIIRINDKKVDNIYDYMSATRGNDPGDTVTVVVLRDGEELTLQVTLAAAR